jgi:MFS family permease
MGVLLRKQKGVHLTGIGKLSVIALLIAFSASLVTTIWAVYIDSFVHSASTVGFISGILTFVSFISFFIFIPLIEKSSKSKILAYSLFLLSLVYIFLSINNNLYIFLLLALISTVLVTLRVTSFGIIIRDKSTKKNLSKNEGIMYTSLNLAFAIGPPLAGYLAVKYSMNIVFFLTSVFFFIAFFIFKIFRIKNINIKKRADTNIIKNFFDFFKNKDRAMAYILGGGVNLWLVLIFLFIPIFIIRNNLSNLWIGYFLFGAVLPPILLEYFFAKLAGKVGFRKIFKIGFLIPAVISFICFFISDIYVILGLLVLSGIGIAMLEPTTEAYFFDTLKGKQELRFYGPYNTTIDVNYFIGEILSATILIFLPFKFLFLLFSFFMMIMFFLSYKVKNIVEEKRR